MAIHKGDANGQEVFTGDIFSGVETRVYDVPALEAGAYTFVCTVHPDMVGTHDGGVTAAMTPTGEQLCYTDAYLRSVEARVAAVERRRGRRSWSSIARSSTRVAAASRRIAG